MAYHGFWVYYLVGQGLAALGFLNMKNEVIAQYNKHNIPIWFWVILIHLCLLFWLPYLIFRGKGMRQ
jgi:4-amino-4-deoxy-L-arabinose transferase-like glycosyltransferase